VDDRHSEFDFAANFAADEVFRQVFDISNTANIKFKNS